MAGTYAGRTLEASPTKETPMAAGAAKKPAETCTLDEPLTHGR